MNNSKQILVVGIVLVAAIIYFNQNTRNYISDVYSQKDYVEVSSILWKARIFPQEIQFISSDKVFYTARFSRGEEHINSVSYRNLDGYYDPVLVSVWRSGKTYKALIIDPLVEQYLLQVYAESEIDISIASNNKIILTHGGVVFENSVDQDDQVISWPLSNYGEK